MTVKTTRRVSWGEAAQRLPLRRWCVAAQLLSIGGLAVGCNAVLGINGAGLICEDGTCDAGVISDAGPNGIDLSRIARGAGAGGSTNSGTAAGGSGGAPGGAPGSSTPLLGRETLPVLPTSGDMSNPGSPPSNSGGSDGSGQDGNAQGGGDGESAPAAATPPSPCDGRPNSVFCEGNLRVTCGADATVERQTTCLSPVHCQQGTAGDCAACLVNEARCDDAVLVSCNAEQSNFDRRQCESALLCDAARNQCQAPACQPNQTICTGSRLERCNATLTGFDGIIDCGVPELCNAAAGRCNACVPNTARCADTNTVATCDATGLAETARDCTVIETCSNARCVLSLPPGLPPPPF